jgi:hypothetical protein
MLQLFCVVKQKTASVMRLNFDNNGLLLGLGLAALEATFATGFAGKLRVGSKATTTADLTAHSTDTDIEFFAVTLLVGSSRLAATFGCSWHNVKTPFDTRSLNQQFSIRYTADEHPPRAVKLLG